MEIVVAVVAWVFFIGVVLTPIALRTGAPLLLLFLGLGMLLGEDGPGRLQFDDFNAAHDLGSLALATILFAGGLETTFTDFRRAYAPALGMATFGVLLTSGLMGGLVHLLLGLPWVEAMLLGAVVGSTDAAATFMLIQQRNIALAGKIRETILIESGLNDPFAIFITLVLVGMVSYEPTYLGSQTAVMFARQVGFGVTCGIAGGIVLARLINELPLLPGMNTILALSGAMMVWGVTASVGGSGFLAVYLCGIVVRNRIDVSAERVVYFHSELAWLSQIALFLMLGLLVTPTDLPAAMGSGLSMAALLIFVARPLAALLVLTPLRVPLRHQLFIGWVGLRGAVPIFLAILPVIDPGPLDTTLFNEVFVIVIVSLVLQGWTIGPAARWLGVSEPDPPKLAPRGRDA